MRNDELKSDTIMKSRGMKSAFIRTGKFVNEYIEIHNPLEGELKAGTTIHVVYRPIDDQIYAVKKVPPLLINNVTESARFASYHISRRILDTSLAHAGSSQDT